jgi:hypothetical protein
MKMQIENDYMQAAWFLLCRDLSVPIDEEEIKHNEAVTTTRIS